MPEFRFELKTNKKGETFFVIVGANNEVIATQEGCKNRIDVIDTIQTIKREAPGASIIDKTK